MCIHEKKIYRKHNPERHFTIIVQLSDPADYIGGVFVSTINNFKPENMSNAIIWDQTLGNMILLNSTTKHAVTKIKMGTRYLLSIWLNMDDIQFHPMVLF